MNIIGLWLDDERDFNSNFSKIVSWALEAKNYEEAIKIIDAAVKSKVNKELHIDFDHDLGDGKTGYDVAKYIVENQIVIASFSIHSMNPVGRKNIYQLLTHYGYKYIF